MSKHDWRTTLGSIVRDFRRTWPQLLAADLLCRVAIYLLLSPLVALVARFFISRSGDAVLTDEEILFFFLRPAGLTALIVVGALTLAIAFAESAIIMTIGFAAAEDRKFAVLDSFRYVYRRFVRLVRLGARLLVRILLLTVPFLAAVALVYYLLLTGSDINFYLTFRPPRFWVALILAGTLGLVWLTLLARALLGWAFALPIVLFEAVGPRVAIRTSLEDTRGRRRELTAWLVAWILLGVGLSAMATAAIGGLGRAVIPTTGGTLPVVAFLVGTVLILSALANLAISFLSTAFLGLIVVGLYRRSTGRGSMGRALDGQKRLAGPAVIRLPRRAWRWIGFAAVAAAAIYATVLSLNVPVGDSIEITAHRGSSGLAPENTMAAVEQAIVDGADWVEIDVQETADGIVVVHHDSDFRKIAGSRLRIWEATYEELRSLDIGSWFAPCSWPARIASG
jgi:glycerophosphoryl diester phosphodiesterase